MRMIQMLPTISFGDAVGNDTLAIRNIISEMGMETGIFAENIDTRLPAGTAKRIDEMPPLHSEDVLIYHASTGTQLNFDLPKFGGKKVMIYHNITPPEFYEGYSPAAVSLTQFGYEGIRFLAKHITYCIADSDYNRQDLRKMGYTCPIDTCPILIPFEDYEEKPDPEVIARYQNDGWTNLLFVGRIAPNKKQEDVIRAFYCYQRRFNPKSRLFLVGSDGGMEKYSEKLRAYVGRLGLQDKVIFPGHIKFNAILAYYHLAHVFVCMSEHEGFCVPLVEAMFFDKPIVAYRSSAIPETMGKGGLLLEKKDPEFTAAVIDRVVKDGALRSYISKMQRERLKAFSYETVKANLLACLKNVLE